MARKINRGTDADWSGEPDRNTPDERISGGQAKTDAAFARKPETLLPAPVPAPPPVEVLEPQDDQDEPVLPAEIERESREFIEHSISKNTIKAYGKDALRFEAWCAANDRRAIPATPKTLQGYVTHLATTATGKTGKPTRPVSIGRALAAISWFHVNKGFDKWTAAKAPIVRLTLKGVRRRLKTRVKQKTPLLLEEVVEAARKIQPSKTSLRDRALLLLGFAAALRRSELTALLISDLDFTPEGLRVWFGKLEARATKGDQEGEGVATVEVPRAPGYGPECPIAAVESWLADLSDQQPRPESTCSCCKKLARDTAKADDRCHGTDDCPTATWIGPPREGPLLRPIARSGAILARKLGDDAVVDAVKAAAKSIGKNPTLYSGHSLRAGCATSMAIHGVPMDQIRSHLRQKTIQTTAGYIRRAGQFKDSAVGKMWAAAGEKK